MKAPKELPRDSELLKKMRQRFALANESESKQSAREQKAIAFENGEQWPTAIKEAREGQAQSGAGPGSMPAVPARPTLVIDKVKEPVRQILNQERQADIGIQLTPADDFGDLGIVPDPDEVYLREGLIRKIQRESHASDARSWAYKRAVIAGRGYYIVRNRFLPGRTWDQEVYTDKIYNQDGVKLDPAHTSSVGSDAEWGFIGTWCPWDRFKSEYPFDADGKEDFAALSDQDFMGMSESYPDWYRVGDGEDGEKAVRIVDHWYTERVSRALGVTEDGQAFWVDEAPEGTPFKDTRHVIEKQIQFVKVAGGCWELERTDEIGPHMPIVKMVGEETLPYDEERRYQGIVEPAMDPCMAFNYMISKMVEMVGLAPIPPMQLDPEAIEGFESWYKVLNTRALPYVPYRTFDDQGRQLAPPMRMNASTDIAAVSAAAGMFDGMIKSTTAVPDSTLGNVDPSLKSGKAIEAVVANAAMSTSNFLDNYKRSMVYEAEIINGKLYPTYGSRPGRLARIITGEGDEQTIAIGQQPNPQLQQAEKVAKLTKDAHFNVIAKISQSSENRRQQFVQMFSQLIGSDPSLMATGGDLFFKNLDIPEARQLAERQKTMLAPPVQQMLAAKDQGQQPPDPQVAQMQQQMQQMQQALQEAQSGMAEKQLDAQVRMQLADKDAQLKMQLAQADAQLKLQLAQAQGQLQYALESLKRQTTLQTTGMEINQKREDTMIEAESKRQAAILQDQGSLRETLAAVDSQAADHAHQRETAAMAPTQEPV